MARALASRDWRQATVTAAGIADPLASELVTWLRLLSAGGEATETQGFIARHPDWPNQAGLRRRLGEALVAASSRTICPAACLPGVPYADAAITAAAADALRQAWIDGGQSAAEEQAFLRKWSGAIDPLTARRRFEHLVWQDGAGALREAARLGSATAAARAWAFSRWT